MTTTFVRRMEQRVLCVADVMARVRPERGHLYAGGRISLTGRITRCGSCLVATASYCSSKTAMTTRGVLAPKSSWRSYLVSLSASFRKTMITQSSSPLQNGPVTCIH